MFFDKTTETLKFRAILHGLHGFLLFSKLPRCYSELNRAGLLIDSIFNCGFSCTFFDCLTTSCSIYFLTVNSSADVFLGKKGFVQKKVSLDGVNVISK